MMTSTEQTVPDVDIEVLAEIPGRKLSCPNIIALARANVNNRKLSKALENFRKEATVQKEEFRKFKEIAHETDLKLERICKSLTSKLAKWSALFQRLDYPALGFQMVDEGESNIKKLENITGFLQSFDLEGILSMATEPESGVLTTVTATGEQGVFLEAELGVYGMWTNQVDKEFPPLSRGDGRATMEKDVPKSVWKLGNSEAKAIEMETKPVETSGGSNNQLDNREGMSLPPNGRMWEKIYKCKDCEQRFCFLTSFHHHIKAHHVSKGYTNQPAENQLTDMSPVKCKVCPMQFKRKAALHCHTQRVHPSLSADEMHSKKNECFHCDNKSKLEKRQKMDDQTTDQQLPQIDQSYSSGLPPAETTVVFIRHQLPPFVFTTNTNQNDSKNIPPVSGDEPTIVFDILK